jgi:hypothetical protein
MAIILSKLALLLSDPPEIAIALLIEGNFLSGKGLSHQKEILKLLQAAQENMKAAEAIRSREYFEITGPQPTAGFQVLATVMESSAYLSPAGLNLLNGGG